MRRRQRTVPLRTRLTRPSGDSLARLQIHVLDVRDVARPDDRSVLSLLVDLVVLHQRDRRAHELVIGPVRLVTGRERVPAAAEDDVEIGRASCRERVWVWRAAVALE